MQFQENLRAYREKAGYTAKEFAALLDIKYSTYAAYENQGREPKYNTLVKIASALHVTTDDLLGYELDKYQKMYTFLENAGYAACINDNGTVTLTHKGKGFPLTYTFPTQERIYTATKEVKKQLEETMHGATEAMLQNAFAHDALSTVLEVFALLSPKQKRIMAKLLKKNAPEIFNYLEATLQAERSTDHE